MTQYRAFRNADPPALAELWCSQSAPRALVQPMTTAVLEQRVFSKPYFDRHGLIVAEEDGRLVGFAHAGLGSNREGCGLSHEVGATCMLMTAPHVDRERIGRGLLERSEQYLIARGVRTLLAGSVHPANAFYLGLYGGSQSPGLLASDAAGVALFRAAGYEEIDAQIVLQRSLAGFRPPVDRRQLQYRRQYRIEPEFDPLPTSWWQACTIGQMERVQHRLFSRETGAACGTVVFWDMERSATSWGVHAMGLMDLEIDADLRGEGLGTFLVAEALRQMQENGATLAEAQADEHNLAALALFRKLGFEQVDRGLVLRKLVSLSPA